MVDVVMKRDPKTGRERPQEKTLVGRSRVVRVVPANDMLRKYLKHGLTKVGFLAEGSAEWPNDQFTRNRIREGDVTIEEAAAPKAEPAPEGEGEPQAIEASGAKAGAKASKPRSDKEAPATETAATVDPNKTTAPKTA